MAAPLLVPRVSGLGVSSEECIGTWVPAETCGRREFAGRRPEYAREVSRPLRNCRSGGGLCELGFGCGPTGVRRGGGIGPRAGSMAGRRTPDSFRPALTRRPAVPIITTSPSGSARQRELSPSFFNQRKDERGMHRVRNLAAIAAATTSLTLASPAIAPGQPVHASARQPNTIAGAAALKAQSDWTTRARPRGPPRCPAGVRPVP
jgi:hypothetical protein